ncbi:hypothetical protein AAMO2058_000880300 [Amorphochlora amoebiformis]
MRPPSPLTLTLLGTVVFVLAMSTSYVAESQFLRNRAPVQARSSHGCASASRRATGKAFLHAIAGLAVTRGMSGEAGALNLPSLPAMPSMPALPALPVGGQAELKSIGKLQAKDGSWEVMIGEGFEEEGKSLINSLSGNHIEQHKFTSTIKPKFSVLVSEDPLPLDVKIPSLDDVAERSIEIEKVFLTLILTHLGYANPNPNPNPNPKPNPNPTPDRVIGPRTKTC